MDQLKEILRQAIKYRFWIAVGISALLPMLAYVLGSEPIKKKAAETTSSILDAEKGVKVYANGVVPNDQYAPLVDEQRAELTKDVDASWEKLYQRQAPLLSWPDTVEKQFREWGNKWPEHVDASVVRLAVLSYVNEYPKVVTEVYKTFRPFDLIEGTGVVSAPQEAVLLKPAPLEVKGSSIPDLGKVWAAQERLWIQRSLLKVIDEVNTGAKDWDTARIKQINLLDVGTRTSQDQVSISEGVELTEAPLLDPESVSAEADAGAAGGEAGGAPGEGGMMPGMMMGGPQADAAAVFFVKSDSVQYKIMPFQLSVLVDQSYIQDVLIALENSPMAIQVSEFSIAKPPTRVTKPVKGAEGMWGDPSMMYGSGMMPGMMPGMTGFGGAAAMSGMMPGMMGPGMEAGYGGMGSMGVAKKGVDARSKDRQKTRKEAEEKARKTNAFTIHDPYYNIIELTVYGQARFYNAPPPPPAEEPSQAGDTPTDPADPNAADKPAEPKTDDPAATEMPKAEDAAKKDETPKAEDAAKKDETPKAEDAAKKDEAPKAEDAPKNEDAPKAEDAAKKDETPKAESAPENADPAKTPSTAPQPQ